MSRFLLLLFLITKPHVQQQAQGTLIIEARSGSGPASQVEVVAGDRIAVTDPRGEATLQLPAGDVEVTLQRFGFITQTVRVSVVANSTIRLNVDLEPEVVLREEITVTATRSEKRIEDEPLRVEVLDREEIEEKIVMAPSDIAMLLNETSGLRVQVTAPSLGAANVRVQGLRGRYTQLLADGLPLYGGQSGSLSLLQIPPLDLGQVEIIKGVASALYGSSALGGVINLVSRRPENPEQELLLNRTSQNGTDAVFWLAAPLRGRWQYTMLGGAHHQGRRDLDDDGWADMAGYKRGTLRPRFFWDNGAGRSFFATASAMIENRAGGTVDGATVPDGTSFPEELRSRRFDAGALGRFVIGNRVLSVRGSAMTQRHRHVFGPVVENDRHDTLFGEAAMSATTGRHAWVAGAAAQADFYRSVEVSRHNYTYAVPAVFAQDDYAFNPMLTVSASGRVDFHNDYGTFFNPRVSALLRLPRELVVRLSSGTGVFAPTPFTEETEAVGLSRLASLQNLEPERAWSASGDLGWSASFVELNGSVFGSVIRDPIMLRLPANAASALEIVNSAGPTRTAGTELLARFRRGSFGVSLTHTFMRSTEVDPNENERLAVPLTPRHTASIVGSWEVRERGRLVLEIFHTGRQRLDDNPFRESSRPYWVFGLSGERRFGPVRLFVNAENFTNVRQTRYDSLVRPQRHPDGRWTVDAWAPLEGRVLNGGVRISF
jgi:outer membrane receptor for ferrienterochelin and colicins